MTIKTQVIVVPSEKETGGFIAPSISVLPLEGWKNNATAETCPKVLHLQKQRTQRSVWKMIRKHTHIELKQRLAHI